MTASGKPREAYAVVSVRAGDLEVVVGVELREGEEAKQHYFDIRAAVVDHVVGTWQGHLKGDRAIAAEVERRITSGTVQRFHGRAYYIEVGHHDELAERPEYRYHVQLYKPWESVAH